MKIIAIAAVSRNGVIGKGNELPWHIPEDMKFFREATRGQIVIMGRKTFESLGKLLPQRENAIITRNPDLKINGARVFHDLGLAIDYYQGHAGDFPNAELFIIGGAQLYRESFPFLDEIWLTEIAQPFEGDIQFPDYVEGVLQRKEFELFQSKPQGELQGPIRYNFNRYRRKK